MSRRLRMMAFILITHPCTLSTDLDGKFRKFRIALIFPVTLLQLSFNQRHQCFPVSKTIFVHALKWEAATEVWWQAELARSLHLWDCVVVNASLPSLSQSVPVPVPAVDGAIPMLMLTSRRHWFGRSAPPRARCYCT